MDLICSQQQEVAAAAYWGDRDAGPPLFARVIGVRSAEMITMSSGAAAAAAAVVAGRMPAGPERSCWLSELRRFIVEGRVRQRPSLQLAALPRDQTLRTCTTYY